MKREHIKGFTLRFFSFYIEVVTIKHIPRVLALGKHYKTLLRFEL
jgi:hypothetical protein